jgi:hypothetical protein
MALPGWAPYFGTTLWRAFRLLWSWTGLGPAFAAVSIFLFARKVFRSGRAIYHRYRRRYADASLGVVVDVAARSIAASFEGRDTKIAIRAWAALFVFSFCRVVWSDRLEFLQTNNNRAAVQILAQSLHENIEEKNKLAAKPAPVVQQATPPRDPSLIRPGAVLSMIADARQSVRDHGPIVFVISAGDDNRAIKGDLDGIFTDACSTKDDNLNSRLVCSIQQLNMAITPISRHQGITLQVNEQPLDSLDKQPLIAALYQALSKWFTVVKDDDPITPAVSKQVTTINGTATVWINIGTGSPWKEDDARVKDDVSREALKSLMGWRDTPKVRAQRIGSALEQLYKSADEMNKTLQSITGDSPGAGFARRAPQRELAMRNGQAISQYSNTFKNQIITLLMDLRLNHVDIRDLDSIIFNVKSYTDVGEIGSRLLAIAKDL